MAVVERVGALAIRRGGIDARLAEDRRRDEDSHQQGTGESRHGRRAARVRRTDCRDDVDDGLNPGPARAVTQWSNSYVLHTTRRCRSTDDRRDDTTSLTPRAC